MKRILFGPSISDADQARLDAIHAMPCIACMILGGLCCGPTEAHHIVDNGYRRLSGGHSSTLPLGRYHHRGIPRDGMKDWEMEALYGPSLALKKRAFIERFGSERELLAMVNEQMGIAV
jgi:hypothetical protein